MRTTQRLAYFGTCLLLLAATTECSKNNSKSSLAKFTVIPPQPIVILGTTQTSTGTAVTGPWFKFRLSMNNGSSDTITVVALQFQTNEEDSSGNQVSNTLSANPTDFNYTTASGLACQFLTFGTWTGGQNQPVQLGGADPSCSTDVTFYIGNNLSGVSGSTFNYRVEVTPLGWFGTYDAPTDRLQTFFDFYTE